MKRLNSIDTIRGFSIVLMIIGHTIEWWRNQSSRWFVIALHSLLGDVAAGGFLLTSGIGAAILFRSRLVKAKFSEEFNLRMARNEYIIRGLLILGIALIYNSCIAFATMNFTYIWKWYIPLTIAISLLLAFPLLKTSKWFRILLGIFVLIANYYILSFLLPFKGQANTLGVLFYILYNSLGLHPILCYFMMFLIGTVVGDLLFDIYLKEDQNDRRIMFKRNFLFLLIIGGFITTFGVFFLFPNFLKHASISSMLYALGILLILLSILLTIEEFKVFKMEKSYRFFYYYSYYSFTIYFAHNMFYFLFYHQLSVLNMCIALLGTFLLLTLLIRTIYKEYGEKFSLKMQIGKLSFSLTMIIEERLNKKYLKIVV